MLTFANRPSAAFDDDLLSPLLRQLDDLRHQADAAPRDLRERGRPTFSPNYELDETEDHFFVRIDVPGVAREDLSIEVRGDRLVIGGERRIGQGPKTRRAAFQRIFSLPEGAQASDVQAECKDGVLFVAIRKPAAAKPTKIKIGDAKGGGFLSHLLGDRQAKTPATNN